MSIFKNKLDRIKLAEIQERMKRIELEYEEYEVMGELASGKTIEELEREKSLVLCESYKYTENEMAFIAITKGITDTLQ
jgi:hypothetical protein